MLRHRVPVSRVQSQDLDPDRLDQVYTNLEAITEGDALYVNASSYVGQARANASSTMHAIGVAVADAASGDPTLVRTRGQMVSSNYDFSGFLGRLGYVSAASAGAIATTPSGSSGDIIQQIGYMTARRTLEVSIGGAYQRGGALA